MPEDLHSRRPQIPRCLFRLHFLVPRFHSPQKAPVLICSSSHEQKADSNWANGALPRGRRRIKSEGHRHLRTCTQEGGEVVGRGAPTSPQQARCLVWLPSPFPSPRTAFHSPPPPPALPPNPRTSADQDATGWFTTKPRRLTPGLAATTDRHGPPHFTLQNLPSSLSPLRPHFLPWDSSTSVAEPWPWSLLCEMRIPRREVSGKQREALCRNRACMRLQRTSQVGAARPRSPVTDARALLLRGPFP